MKNCKHCENQFKDNSRTNTALFCSKTCKNSYWYVHNKEHAIRRNRAYELANSDAVRSRKRNYVNKRRAEDLNFRIASNLRARVSRAIKNSFKHSTLSIYLGCTIEELKKHLESQFEPGMTWDNYGQWEIDHIYPLAKANLVDPMVFVEVCRYTNLQPLWKLDNKVKKDKVCQI
jgi:hypothetical protein